MYLQLLKITGESLEPVFRDGDYVLVSKIPILFRGVRPGDVVIFEHPRLGKLIKLVDRLECGGKEMFLVGLNPESVDSRTFGAVPCRLALGKVIRHIRKQ